MNKTVLQSEKPRRSDCFLAVSPYKRASSTRGLLSSSARFRSYQPVSMSCLYLLQDRGSAWPAVQACCPPAETSLSQFLHAQ